MGYLMLAGGAEFGGRMAEADKRAIELAGGPGAQISIIPAAAAPDQNHERAGRNGVGWFASLGAHATAVPLIDRSSANDPAIAAALGSSQLIYLLGGFPDHLAQSLAGSASWRAILDAHAAGAVIAGSSAGAMMLCEHYYNPQSSQLASGLGLLSRACVLPHHNTFGKRWAPELAGRLPASVLIGIDERTAMINDRPNGMWCAYGPGAITLYQGGQKQIYQPGQAFDLY